MTRPNRLAGRHWPTLLAATLAALVGLAAVGGYVLRQQGLRIEEGVVAAQSSSAAAERAASLSSSAAADAKAAAEAAAEASRAVGELLDRLAEARSEGEARAQEAVEAVLAGVEVIVADLQRATARLETLVHENQDLRDAVTASNRDRERQVAQLLAQIADLRRQVTARGEPDPIDPATQDGLCALATPMGLGALVGCPE